MKIVAFLQNMWVKNPESTRKIIARHDEPFRLRILRYSLFAGCVTGRRLKSAFGEELCEQIIWEESTREIAGDPKTIFPAQPEHIKKVLSDYQPLAVLTFGRIAKDSVKPFWNGIFISCPHPAARQPDTFSKLQNAAVQIHFLLKEPSASQTLKCSRFGCENSPLIFLRVGDSRQTKNAFLTVKIDGFYCPVCAGGYGGEQK